MKLRIAPAMMLAALLAATFPLLAQAEEKDAADPDGYTRSFGESPDDFASTGRNDFFILDPGWVQEYRSDSGKTVLLISVLQETKLVDGVETRVVEEREMDDGEVEEISLNYFAISKRTNNVYYFGEATADYKDGKVTSTHGSWESGKDGAKYGLIMPAVPLLGAKYYQEIAPGEAMDRAEIVSLTETMTVPLGEYKNVVKTTETSPLEPKSSENKYYAAGVGLLKDGSLKLVFSGIREAPPAEKKE